MSLLGKKILNILNNPAKAKKPSAIKNFEESNEIGILYTWEDNAKMNHIQEFADSLNKQVSILAFNPSKEPIECIHPIFSIDELSNLGKIKSETVQQFLTKHFDYLFVLDFDISEVGKHIIVNSNANCRVGCHREKSEGYFDLMISINENAGISNFTEQILKYVKAIKNG